MYTYENGVGWRREKDENEVEDADKCVGVCVYVFVCRADEEDAVDVKPFVREVIKWTVYVYV